MAEQIFPTAQEVEKYEHVIFFTCALMVHPDVLLELVCSKLLIDFQHVPCKISDKSEIQSSLRGIELLVHLHAEICVTRRKFFVWTGQEVGAVLGPNKLCVCLSNGADAFIRHQGSGSDTTECAFVADNLSSVDDFMTDCLDFGKFVLSSLCLIVNNGSGIFDEDEESNITKVVLENFKLPQNILMAMVRNCSLPKAAYNYVVQQLHNCKKLKFLHLEELDCVPIEITRALYEMHSLVRFVMNNCKCEIQTLKAAAEALGHCSDHLSSLTLARIEGVPIEFAETISKMTSLEELRLVRTPTSKAAMRALPNCSMLKYLDLQCNSLTDCIADLLGVDNLLGFCNLTYLDLHKTGLSRDDVANLGTALSSAKLPKVSGLVLACNGLTNCVRLLLGSSTIASLRTLDLRNTRLNKSDMTYLSDVVKNKRLPELKYIDLRINNLDSMEQETKELLSSCVGQYAKTQFELDLRENSLSDVFQDKVAALCFGTKIKLTFN